MMEAFKPSCFWKTCHACNGTGKVLNSNKNALSSVGRKTGYPYPAITGGCSGEIVAEPNKAYCGRCMGTGMKVLKELK